MRSVAVGLPHGSAVVRSGLPSGEVRLPLLPSEGSNSSSSISAPGNPPARMRSNSSRPRLVARPPSYIPRKVCCQLRRRIVSCPSRLINKSNKKILAKQKGSNGGAAIAVLRRFPKVQPHAHVPWQWLPSET
jgi:hypothetical protein